MDKPEDLSDRESEVWVDVPVVPDVTDVTDVPMSPSSVITEFCDGFLFFLYKACSFLYSYAGKDEVVSGEDWECQGKKEKESKKK